MKYIIKFLEFIITLPIYIKIWWKLKSPNKYVKQRYEFIKRFGVIPIAKLENTDQEILEQYCAVIVEGKVFVKWIDSLIATQISSTIKHAETNEHTAHGRIAVSVLEDFKLEIQKNSSSYLAKINSKPMTNEEQAAII